MAFLRSDGHDVVSAISVDPRASDEKLLEYSLNEARVLVTEDKDFGELLFVKHCPHGPLIRVVELSVDEQVRAIGELIELHPHELTGAVVVTIARGRIRIRRRDA